MTRAGARIVSWRVDCKEPALGASTASSRLSSAQPGTFGAGSFFVGTPSCAHKGMQSNPPSGCHRHCSSATTEMAPEARSAGGSPRGPWFACSSFPLLPAPALPGECILPPPHAPGFEHVTCFGQWNVSRTDQVSALSCPTSTCAIHQGRTMECCSQVESHMQQTQTSPAASAREFQVNVVGLTVEGFVKQLYYKTS